MIYPKPYSSYLRGTINSLAEVSLMILLTSFGSSGSWAMSGVLPAQPARLGFFGGSNWLLIGMALNIVASDMPGWPGHITC